MKTYSVTLSRTFSVTEQDIERYGNLNGLTGKDLKEEMEATAAAIARAWMDIEISDNSIDATEDYFSEKIKTTVEKANPAQQFVQKVNEEQPGTFPDIDGGKDITDYSNQSGGEVIVK